MLNKQLLIIINYIVNYVLKEENFSVRIILHYRLGWNTDLALYYEWKRFREMPYHVSTRKRREVNKTERSCAPPTAQ